eukprot:3047506-Pyramimonas_sp.AAC.1
MDSDDGALNLMDDPNYQRQQDDFLAALQSQPRLHTSHGERPREQGGGEDQIAAGFLNYVSRLLRAVVR